MEFDAEMLYDKWPDVSPIYLNHSITVKDNDTITVFHYDYYYLASSPSPCWIVSKFGYMDHVRMYVCNTFTPHIKGHRRKKRWEIREP